MVDKYYKSFAVIKITQPQKFVKYIQQCIFIFLSMCEFSW